MKSEDISALLGEALRDIRKRTAGTQEKWEEMTGMSQSYLSAAERGNSGWDSVKGIAEAIERADVDPLELLQLAVARAEGGAEQRELLTLWAQVDEITKGAVLTLLRGQVGARSAAR